MASESVATTINTEKIVKDILGTVDREREREIIARRFGLFDRKETLEQIGELLGITRERVRQLEKAVVAKLAASAKQNNLPHITEINSSITENLSQNGLAARVSDLTETLVKSSDKLDQARLAFLAQLCPDVTVLGDDDNFFAAVAIKQASEAEFKKRVNTVLEAVKKNGKPETINTIAELAKISDPAEAKAFASVSKNLATLNGQWGLTKWPTVNPKNIRDKIYVILSEKGSHMHFNEIAGAIKDSSFKRKDVTTQAIHNELIKDKRFVLIGRGIYALKEWGYEKGTVADIITEILKKEGGPLHRDEIVKRVLKNRYVKETTILLNLQGKPQFKRVAKATYGLNEA